MNQAILLAIVVFTAAVWHAIRRRRSPLPPGPKGGFLIGNLRQMPTHHQWLTYTKWAKGYGPIFSLRIFTKNVIVLNSGAAVIDLLESRSNMYSDRPRSTMNVMLGRQLSVFTTPSTSPRFRTYRKLMHSGLNARASLDYQQLQLDETKTFLHGLSTTPDALISHIRRNAGAVILKVAYGYRVQSDGDFFINLVEEGFRLPGTLPPRIRLLYEAFPILCWIPSWVPGFSYKQKAADVAEKLGQVDTIPFQMTKKEIDSGNFVESFTSKLLEQNDHEDPEEHQDIVKWVSAALYVGGADTTVSAFTSFFWLMANHPEVQKRAQAEVDEVVGEGLPGFEHLGSLSYVTAILKEILRWGPVAPLGLPHRVVDDDVYEGYRIPKGSTLFANIWAVMHDEELYPNPTIFDPTRHLGDNPQTDPYKFAFGFGRRVCPGAHFAQQSLLLNISSILSTFDISKAKDGCGQVIETPLEWSTGVTSHIQPFPCAITLRSKGTVLNAL